MTCFPNTSFTNEVVTGDTGEVAISAKKAPRNQPSCFFFISCFTALVIPSINTLPFYIDFFYHIPLIPCMLICPYYIFSDHILRPCIFLSKMCCTDEVILVANCGKISSVKGAQKFNSAFLPKLATVSPIVFYHFSKKST